MIKVKNAAEYIVKMRRAGAAAVASDADNFCVPAAGYIKAVVASFGVMGTDGTGSPTTDLRADVKKNGTSIFASAATSIVWLHAGQLGTANTPSNADSISAPSVNPTAVAKGDKLQLDITQILNGTSPVQPTDLSVFVVLTRGNASPPEGMLLNQLSELDA